MATFRNSMRDVSWLKPEGFEDCMTITEVAREVNRDIAWIRRLERADRIPVAARVGPNKTRLWTPAQVGEIRVILSKMRRGRPRG